MFSKLVATLSMLLAGLVDLAPQTGRICGTVRGAGGPLQYPARIVLLSDLKTDLIPTAPLWTAADGSFSFELPAASYTLLVLDPEHAPWSRPGVRIDPGETARLEIRLGPPTPSSPVYYDAPTAKALAEYASSLKAFAEPPFCDTASVTLPGEAYRFLWMRSFHRPILIQLVLSQDGAAIVRYKEMDGAGGYELGKLVVNETFDYGKKLRQEDPDWADQAIKRIGEMAQEEFWQQPYRIDDGTLGLDGATWTVEGRKDGRCKVVTRWSPERGDPVRRFADFLIQASGNRFYYDEVY